MYVAMTMKNLTTLTIYFSRLVLAFARERQFYRSNQRVDRRPYNPERREAQITGSSAAPALLLGSLSLPAHGLELMTVLSRRNVRALDSSGLSRPRIQGSQKTGATIFSAASSLNITRPLSGAQRAVAPF